MKLWMKSMERKDRNWLWDHWGLDLESLGEQFIRFLSEYTGYPISEFDSKLGYFWVDIHLPKSLVGDSDRKFYLKLLPWMRIFSLKRTRKKNQFQLYGPRSTANALQILPVKNSPTERTVLSYNLEAAYVTLPKEEVQALEEKATDLILETPSPSPEWIVSLEPGDPLYEDLWNWFKKAREDGIKLFQKVLPPLHRKLLKRPPEHASLVRAAYDWNVLLNEFFDHSRDLGLGIPFFWTHWEILGTRDLFPRLEARQIFIPFEGGLKARFLSEADPERGRALRLDSFHFEGPDIQMELR